MLVFLTNNYGMNVYHFSYDVFDMETIDCVNHDEVRKYLINIFLTNGCDDVKSYVESCMIIYSELPFTGPNGLRKIIGDELDDYFYYSFSQINENMRRFNIIHFPRQNNFVENFETLKAKVIRDIRNSR